MSTKEIASSLLNRVADEEDDDDPCWEGYEQYGMKEDEDGNMVPNCVPKESSNKVSSLFNRLVKMGNENPKLRGDISPVLHCLKERSKSASHKAPSYMSEKHLRQICHQSGQLLSMIHDDTPLDDWVESHLAESASRLGDVYDHMVYGDGLDFSKHAAGMGPRAQEQLREQVKSALDQKLSLGREIRDLEIVEIEKLREDREGVEVRAYFKAGLHSDADIEGVREVMEKIESNSSNAVDRVDYDHIQEMILDRLDSGEIRPDLLGGRDRLSASLKMDQKGLYIEGTFEAFLG